jgi:hypothetical protein
MIIEIINDNIEKFIAIYVFIDDILIEIGYKEPVNRNQTYSELIPVALIAAKYIQANIMFPFTG